ncbi:MAG: hypothetical protein OXH00_16745 [Candidatus Poribacteria bacterium]|nr:hypothetical protein [Candidatus Poribacteria bacterium]MDE0017044.1 hypothetical protein [Candidatus Poribacteria bacterium]
MQYDKNRFEIWAIPHPLILFYILFPSAIFSELIFGQRLPKVMLVDKKSDKPWMERTHVPCPHCETLNDGRLWTKWNAFGHWFGLVCPSCHQVIPCLWNIFSLVVLAMTCPLWYFPARFFRQKWLELEKSRLANVLKRPLIQAARINWIFIGIFYWGGSTWMTFNVLWTVFNGSEWDLIRMIGNLPIWLVAGFVWGVWMRSWMNRKR